MNGSFVIMLGRRKKMVGVVCFHDDEKNIGKFGVGVDQER